MKQQQESSGKANGSGGATSNGGDSTSGGSTALGGGSGGVKGTGQGLPSPSSDSGTDYAWRNTNGGVMSNTVGCSTDPSQPGHLFNE